MLFWVDGRTGGWEAEGTKTGILIECGRIDWTNGTVEVWEESCQTNEPTNNAKEKAENSTESLQTTLFAGLVVGGGGSN